MTNLAFVQPYVPEYRVPFFQGLRSVLTAHGISINVVVSRTQSPRGDGAVTFPQIVAMDRLAQVTGDRLRWRARLASTAGTSASQLVIVEHALRNLDSLPLLARQYVRGPGVAMWGHGRPQSASDPIRDVAKAFVARRAEWYFVYTESGAKSLREIGLPRSRITVIGNTVDTSALATALRAVTTADAGSFTDKLGLTPGHTALFMGALDQHKGVDSLVPLAYEAHRRDPAFVLLIGGDGPLRGALEKEARRGAPVRVLGRLAGDEKALALSSASLLVIPKGIGLVAVDALVAGLPVISCLEANHGPEAEYLVESRHAIRLVSRDPVDLARCVTELLASPQRLATMQEACREAAGDHSMDRMIRRTMDGILAWREIHEHGLGH